MQVRFHPDIADRLRGYAKKYDVNNGVLLGYILREYYETDGWGYSIEAVGSDSVEDRTPTTRSEKLTSICEQIDTSGNGDLLATDVREVIADVAGPTVVDGANGYLSDVLDRLGYVYHPHVAHLFVPEDLVEENFRISPDAPAYQR